MRKLTFRYKCFKIKQELKRDWRRAGWTYGLCTYIDTHIPLNYDASWWFEGKFRSDSPNPRRTFWLGNLISKEGYKNRLKYLKMFKKKAIETGEYRKW